MHTLSAVSLSKHYSLKKALDNVTLTFETGKLYALLGENGAGKSTLASLLSGDALPTAGQVLLDGAPVQFRDPQDALKKGIAVVHQQPLLVDELTVLENCILGAEPVRQMGLPGLSGLCRFFGLLDRKRARKELQALAQQWDIVLPFDEKAATLSAPQRMHAALLSNLYKKPSFLILDEPSATLDETQRTTLFSHVREAARQQGLCIIFITHNIQEALDNADELIVLKKGRLQLVSANSQETGSGLTADALTDIMFQKRQDAPQFGDMLNAGDKLDASARTADTAPAADGAARPTDEAASPADACGQLPDTPVLALEHVTVRPAEGAALFDVSFTVPRGKLTCISGQRESGMSTLEDLVTGMSHGPYTGTVCFEGTALPQGQQLSPSLLRSRNVAIIPFNKQRRGSDPSLTIRELLGSTTRNPDRIISQVKTDIKPDELVKNLSGGMLQRLIIARELFTDPPFVIMASPSYGLDRFSTGKVTETVMSLLSKGATVLVLATEEPELESLADVRYQLVSGKLTAEVRS